MAKTQKCKVPGCGKRVNYTQINSRGECDVCHWTRVNAQSSAKLTVVVNLEHLHPRTVNQTMRDLRMSNPEVSLDPTNAAYDRLAVTGDHKDVQRVVDILKSL